MNVKSIFFINVQKKSILNCKKLSIICKKILETKFNFSKVVFLIILLLQKSNPLLL